MGKRAVAKQKSAKFRRFAKYILLRNRYFELGVFDNGLVPSPVTDTEKYLYTTSRHSRMLLLLSAISFTAAFVSVCQFVVSSPALAALIGYLVLTVMHFLISQVVNLGTRDFDLASHLRLVAAWAPRRYPSIDVFLPTAGEPLSVLRNTWEGVAQAARHYPGVSIIYCLDDADRPEVKQLAREFGYHYEVRPNRGQYKKAGNLRHGFKISRGDLIAIFDADFRPRYDFLTELAPYFDADRKIGIVQSPQYFRVGPEQGWLERGAGAVQELFYRYSQVSRQDHGAAICVGSNAIYRRAALNDIGGTALIEHSEDVHTGFNLRKYGWKVHYLPVILAKGLCPSGMNAFFKQQYRWCMGSMSLMQSAKFRQTKMSFRARASYFSGFMYYIHTAVSSLFAPVIPLIVLTAYHDRITLQSILLILPSMIFALLIFPAWHRSIYGVEAWSTRSVYGWAHLFALVDSFTKRAMQWHPTGSKMSADYRYLWFRALQVMFNFVPAVLWVSLAGYHLISSKTPWLYLPIFISGIYFLAVTVKVVCYRDKTAIVHAPVPAKERSRALRRSLYRDGVKSGL